MAHAVHASDPHLTYQDAEGNALCENHAGFRRGKCRWGKKCAKSHSAPDAHALAALAMWQQQLATEQEEQRAAAVTKLKDAVEAAALPLPSWCDRTREELIFNTRGDGGGADALETMRAAVCGFLGAQVQTGSGSGSGGGGGSGSHGNAVVEVTEPVDVEGTAPASGGGPAAGTLDRAAVHDDEAVDGDGQTQTTSDGGSTDGGSAAAVTTANADTGTEVTLWIRHTNKGRAFYRRRGDDTSCTLAAPGGRVRVTDKVEVKLHALCTAESWFEERWARVVRACRAAGLEAEAPVLDVGSSAASSTLPCLHKLHTAVPTKTTPVPVCPTLIFAHRHGGHKLPPSWKKALMHNKRLITRFHRSLHYRAFLDAFHAFVRDVIAPLCGDETGIVFQSPPTLRVQMPSHAPTIGLHCDSEYDRHESSEINFWIPLTAVFGSNTLQLESKPGASDFRAMGMDLGQGRSKPIGFHRESAREHWWGVPWGGVGAPRQCSLGGGSLLPSLYADVRCIDDVIAL